MATETPQTFRSSDGKVISLQEYKKALAIKVLPIGFILGGVVGLALKDWNIKESWKFALGASILGTGVAMVFLHQAYNRIEKPANE